MKTDPGLRFDVELLNTGYDKSLLEKLLLRIKGLSLSPEIIVKSCPCIIAINISGSASKKLRQYLGQVGAHVAIRSHTNAPHSFPSDTGPSACCVSNRFCKRDGHSAQVETHWLGVS